MTKMTRRYLRSILAYDPDTGEWCWRIKKSGRALAGTIAGSPHGGGRKDRPDDTGSPYLGIRIDGSMYMAHRLAFLYMLGRWPYDQIDHIDRNRMNNRWLNLREATNGQNMTNGRLRSDTSSGYTGVYAYSDRWRAKIVVDGRQIYLGIFKTKEEAAAAYEAAAERFHGEFARSK